jgi:hypothetical protein
MILKFYERNLRMTKLKQILLLPALIAGTNAFAEAPPAQKVLTLSVGPSLLFTKDVPKLSLSNGPLAEDEKTIGLVIDMDAFLKLFANYKNLKQESDFYREVRNFRDGRAEIVVKYVDGTVSTTTFSLESGAPDEGIIQPSEFIFDVDAQVTGTVDVYKCFNAQTCTFEETRAEQLRAEEYGGRVVVEHNFRPLVNCRGNGHFIDVEGSIDHPEIQRITFHRTVADTYLRVKEVITAKSTPVQTGAEFNGFTTEIGNFGLPYGHQAPGTTLEVIRQNEGLVVTTRNPDGSLRSSSGLEKCANFP